MNSTYILAFVFVLGCLAGWLIRIAEERNRNIGNFVFLNGEGREAFCLEFKDEKKLEEIKEMGVVTFRVVKSKD